jgi:molybdate transport system substrate-binding protein
MRGWGRILGAVAALAVALAGCSAGNAGVPAASGGTNSGPAGAPSPGSRGAGDDLSGTLTVFAAASLKATFDQLRTRFLAAHPGVHFPEITYDGSSTLVTQIRNGAPADVFASADEANMDKVAELVASRADFATNTLQIAVAPGNPKDITSLADLAKPGVVTVICEAPVPCGAASHRALDAAGVTLTPASEEQNVAAVLTKVATGDADAGLVYATDVKSSGGKVQGIDFPQAARAVNTYPIAVLKDSGNAAAARAFVDLVTGTEGRAVLAAAGFGPP